jgi:plastocyanin
VSEQVATTEPRDGPSRRQFLGVVAGGLTASVGVAGVASAQDVPTVSMEQNYFDPVGLFVEPGTTVRFVVGEGSHSATAYEDRIPPTAQPFDSGVRSEGSFEYTFEEPGTYDYYCTPHESMGMVGRVVVGQPGGPAEDNPIPEGDVPGSDVIVEEGTVTGEDSEFSHGMGGGGGMGAGRGTGGGPGWMLLVPVGFATTVLGVIGAFAYWATRRKNGGGDRE